MVFFCARGIPLGLYFAICHLFLVQLCCFQGWKLVHLTFDNFHAGLILQGHLIPAVQFASRHNDCFFDIALLSTVSKLSLSVVNFYIHYWLYLLLICVIWTSLHSIINIIILFYSLNEWSYSNDRIRNREKVGAALIIEKLVEACFKWFGHDKKGR